MRERCALLLLILAVNPHTLSADDKDPTQFIKSGDKLRDPRLAKPKTLNGYFPMIVPESLKEWKTRRQQLREQVLVGNGLWPMPKKTPLKPVIHGKIDRKEYTIEKVFFASHPGFYVTGNLYRPKNAKGKRPGILCPHGHWSNGRLYDTGEAAAKKLIAGGGEKWMDGARSHFQARCVQLARMGCVVFHYDMVGYADSKQIAHRAGFTDAEAELRLQNFMGLQTWNSIRALDFLTSLPEVDPNKIGVTGASGGGTQTFILCAVDDRPAVAFPAVMVSTAMQGGCICENCTYLRVGAGNIHLAALFAPKPLAMSGANDWTVDIETKGLPELKELYALYGVPELVHAKCYKQFGHNYNQVSRELMYNWMNKHLKLGQNAPVKETQFERVEPSELSVFDTAHPRPKDAVDAKALRRYWTKINQEQMDALKPTDAKSLKEFRRVVGTALEVMVGENLPASKMPYVSSKEKEGIRDGITWRGEVIKRSELLDRVPTLTLRPAKHNGTFVVWIHPEGKSSLVKNGTLIPEAKEILDSGAAILAPDVFRTGEVDDGKRMPIDKRYAGYTFGYNQSLLAKRVYDIHTIVKYAQTQKAKKIHLVGFGKAGPWVALARGLCGDAVARTAVDFNQFRFENVRETTDEMMLPGALKYGGLPAFVSLAAPGELFVHNHKGTGSGNLMKDVYKAAGASEKLKRDSEKVSPEKVVEWLLR